MNQNMKKVTFDLEKNQIFIFNRYIQKYNYKTKKNILFFFLYKNINYPKWSKYLPLPSSKKIIRKISYEHYNIKIIYEINKWGMICLYISNDFNCPNFFSLYIHYKNFNIKKFRIIIINYIKKICLKNNIF